MSQQALPLFPLYGMLWADSREVLENKNIHPLHCGPVLAAAHQGSRPPCNPASEATWLPLEQEPIGPLSFLQKSESSHAALPRRWAGGELCACSRIHVRLGWAVQFLLSK